MSEQETKEPKPRVVLDELYKRYLEWLVKRDAATEVFKERHPLRDF